MSTSRSSTSANQSQTTNTQNLNLQDNDGIALADVSGSVTITTTDHDALATAGEISREAIALGREGFVTGADLAGRGIDTAIGAVRDTSRDSLDFAEFLSGRSLDTVTGLADSAISQTAGTTREAFDFADRSLASVASLAEKASTFAKDLVSDTVQGFKDLSLQTNASSDDRVTKIATYAVIAVALAMVLPALFRS